MLRKILNSSQFDAVIRNCFGSDETLYTKWHINAGQGLESCVSRTVKELLEMPLLKFYTINKEDDIIGFYGIEDSQFLTTIFIKPEYRTKVYMGPIWDLIKSGMKKPFFSSIYAKNEKCSNFYKRNNGIILKETTYLDNPVLIFEFKE